MRECIVAPTLTADDSPQALTLKNDDTLDKEIFSSDDIPNFIVPIDVEGICPVVHTQFFTFNGSFRFNNLIFLGPN